MVGKRKILGPTIQITMTIALWPPTSCAKMRSEEHTSELQSQSNLVCRLLLEKKKYTDITEATNVHIGLSYGCAYIEFFHNFLTLLSALHASLPWHSSLGSISHSLAARSESYC